MKKTIFTLICLAAMLAAGRGLQAQEVTVVLNPGWTWISCPSTEAMDFATALGDFTPMAGDAIKSQWGNAYYRNGRWAGSISQFYPGYGYKYYSNRNVPVLLTFNAQQSTQQVVVTTSEPMFITGNSAMGGGEVTTTDGTYIIVKGLCWATHENPTTNDDFYQEAESGVGSFSLSMTSLSISTTYYVRAYAVTPSGTIYGAQKSFTTRDGIPTLSTAEVTDITAITAICGGDITDNGGLSVISCGVCWSTNPDPVIDDTHVLEAYDFENGLIPTSWTNDVIYPWIVSPDTSTGNYCIKSGNSGVHDSSSSIQIMVEFVGVGTVGFDALCQGESSSNNIYYDKCIFSIDGEKQFIYGANVSGWNHYSFPVTAGTHIFEWSYTKDGSVNPTGDAFSIDNVVFTDPVAFTEISGSTGSFSSIITCLSVSTTYYVRAYATTAAGTAYGDEKTFTTRDGIPSVTTADVTNIMAESATCGGTVTDNCGLAVIARGVCWSTSPTPTLDDSHTTNGSGNGSFSSSITGLSLNTTYYVRAYATTSAGTGYGEQLSFTTRNGIPTVTTTDVTNIEPTWAYSGGTITDDGGGLTITAKGVCWSISPYPTLADSHTNDGNGTNSYTSYIIGLNLSTTYYVRAYVTNSIVTVYGNQLSFTTPENWSPSYVDLGLPSGLLWATCNVGAEAPEDYGDYFAWGETQQKDYYDWSTYQYCMGSSNTLTKYCNNSSYGYNGFTDNLTTLLPEDDAATANWGNDWRMPTKEEWQELYQNTTHTWTTQNGVNGRLFTASNGNSLFLPAAGYRGSSGLHGAGSYGNYWSSSLRTYYTYYAWYFYIDSGGYGMYYSDYGHRNYGLSVRPVRSASQN